MENTLTVALSRQMVMRRNMEVIANNLANMNTTAFKKETVVFETYLQELETESNGSKALTFVMDRGVSRDATEGRIEPTGAPLDFAISGDGYFQVETQDGVRYTRNGHFRLDPEGRLITTDGHPVLDADGRPIVTTPEDGGLRVAKDGTITALSGRAVAQMGIVSFDAPGALSREGASLYSATINPQPAEDAVVLQGSIEQSNVVPIMEMARMIEIMRSYQSASRIVTDGNELSKKAIEKLGKVQA